MAINKHLQYFEIVFRLINLIVIIIIIFFYLFIIIVILELFVVYIETKKQTKKQTKKRTNKMTEHSLKPSTYCTYARCDQFPPRPYMFYKYGSQCDQGDSILGIYGTLFHKFKSHQMNVLPCSDILKDTQNVSPVFYKGVQPNNHPSSSLLYKGQDYRFRKDAL